MIEQRLCPHHTDLLCPYDEPGAECTVTALGRLGCHKASWMQASPLRRSWRVPRCSLLLPALSSTSVALLRFTEYRRGAVTSGGSCHRNRKGHNIFNAQRKLLPHARRLCCRPMADNVHRLAPTTREHPASRREIATGGRSSDLRSLCPAINTGHSRCRLRPPDCDGDGDGDGDPSANAVAWKPYALSDQPTVSAGLISGEVGRYR